MKRIYWVLASITTCLLASCNSSTKDAREYQTVKIDTVTSANGQTYLQYPGKVKAAQGKRNYPEDICKRRRPCTSGTVACRTGPDGLPSTTGCHRSRIQTDKSGSGTRNGPVQRERDYSQRQRQGCVRTETNHRQISAPQRPAGLHPPLRSLQRLYTKTSV